MFPFVTFFLWCIPTILSSTVWAVGDRLFKAYTLKHKRGSVCIWTLESIFKERVEISDPTLSKSKDKDVLILGLPTESNLLLNEGRISTGKQFLSTCLVGLCCLIKVRLGASGSGKIFYFKHVFLSRLGYLLDGSWQCNGESSGV